MDFGKLFSEFGLIGIIVGTLFFILWRMLVWVMAFVKEEREQQRHEREQYREERAGFIKTLDTINSSIQLHNQQSIESRRAVEEGHRFQREEHKQMIEILGRINGYKHD
ncbi:MAG: hypothetical protein SFH39_00520 [Candidatus Magnetobacterium sp. LHC-1]